MRNSVLLIRADAGVSIGTGHVMRSLALAQAWRDTGGQVVFVMASSTASVNRRISEEWMDCVIIDAEIASDFDAAETLRIAADYAAEWIAIDGYGFGAAYQQRLKAGEARIVVIDENGKCEHYFADVVLNQNPHCTAELYSNREAHTRLLLGTQYVMLRTEFLASRDHVRSTPEFAGKVLITFGGSDPQNVSFKAVQALAGLHLPNVAVKVVVGGSNPHADQLQRAVSDLPNFSLVRDCSDMRSLMQWADVAVAAAGVTSYELCYLGVPGILIHLTPNVAPLAHALHEAGAAVHLGAAEEVSSEEIAESLRALLMDASKRRRMSQIGQQLVDGRGAARLVEVLKNYDAHTAANSATEYARS